MSRGLSPSGSSRPPRSTRRGAAWRARTASRWISARPMCPWRRAVERVALDLLEPLAGRAVGLDPDPRRQGGDQHAPPCPRPRRRRPPGRTPSCRRRRRSPRRSGSAGAPTPPFARLLRVSRCSRANALHTRARRRVERPRHRARGRRRPARRRASGRAVAASRPARCSLHHRRAAAPSCSASHCRWSRNGRTARGADGVPCDERLVLAERLVEEQVGRPPVEQGVVAVPDEVRASVGVHEREAHEGSGRRERSPSRDTGASAPRSPAAPRRPHGRASRGSPTGKRPRAARAAAARRGRTRRTGPGSPGGAGTRGARPPPDSPRRPGPRTCTSPVRSTSPDPCWSGCGRACRAGWG